MSETVVNTIATTVTLASNGSSVYGQSVTFSASVAPSAAVGTIAYYNGSTLIGCVGTNSYVPSPNPENCTSSSSAATTFTTSQLPTGTDTITAYFYTAGGNYASSANAPTVTWTVNQASTTTTLSSSANPVLQGATVTFTATVAPVAPGAGTPTGTVTFYDGATEIGTGSLSGGVATLSTSTLPSGSDSITAVYGGDTNFLGSTSVVFFEEVNAITASDMTGLPYGTFLIQATYGGYTGSAVVTISTSGITVDSGGSILDGALVIVVP